MDLYGLPAIPLSHAIAFLVGISPLVNSYNKDIEDYEGLEVIEHRIKSDFIGPTVGLGMCALILTLFVW